MGSHQSAGTREPDLGPRVRGEGVGAGLSGQKADQRHVQAGAEHIQVQLGRGRG